MIRWDHVSEGDMRLIVKIVERAKRRAYCVMHNWQTLDMDINAAHLDTELDLEKLLESPLADFLHDLGGIQRFINRRTGELEKGFCPRSAKPEAA